MLFCSFDACFVRSFGDVRLTVMANVVRSYTQALPLSADTALICYERQGASSGGMSGKPPKECVPKGSQIFCMRVRVTA